MSEVKQIPLSKLEVNNGQIDGLHYFYCKI